MKRSIPALAVPLALTAVLVQGDGHSLPANPLFPDATQVYSSTPKVLTSPQAQNLFRVRPSTPYRYGPGDSLPHAYMVFGLRTSPSGMAFTDENGTVLMTAQPKVINGPFVSTPPHVSPPYPAPKIPQK